MSACSFELVVAYNVLHLYPKAEQSALLKRLIQPLQLQGGLLLSAYSEGHRPREVELVMMTARTRLAAGALPPDLANALLATRNRGVFSVDPEGLGQLLAHLGCSQPLPLFQALFQRLWWCRRIQVPEVNQVGGESAQLHFQIPPAMAGGMATRKLAHPDSTIQRAPEVL